MTSSYVPPGSKLGTLKVATSGVPDGLGTPVLTESIPLLVDVIRR
jgi:hypothetical protein